MRRVTSWAGDLAIAGALMMALLAGTPAAPVWFGLIAEDVGAVRLFEPSLALLFLVLVLVARRMRAAVAAADWKRAALAFAADQNGALVLEFALIFPFIMALVFILFQWAEVLMADGLVHYAAFAAARAATTYANVAGSTPEQPNGERWRISGNCMDAMKRAASAALMGAYVIEGGMQHDTVRVSLIDAQQQNALKDDPSDGKGGYKLVHVKVEWGFIPRWPMSFLFFRPILKDKRILIEGQYAMQIEGYYRSPSLNQRSNAATEGDTYANGQQPPPQNTREGEIQKALYDEVLPEDHKPRDAVSGDRDSLGRNCN